MPTPSQPLLGKRGTVSVSQSICRYNTVGCIGYLRTSFENLVQPGSIK